MAIIEMERAEGTGGATNEIGNNCIRKYNALRLGEA